MSGLTGDFKTLNSMRKRLTAVEGAPSKTAQAVAPYFAKAVQDEFPAERGPSGKKWKKDKPKTYALGTKSILFRSGTLYGTIKAVAQGAKIRVSLGMEYLRFQIGKGRNPLPKKGTPKQWSEEVRKEASRVIRELLR